MGISGKEHRRLPVQQLTILGECFLISRESVKATPFSVKKTILSVAKLG